MKLRTLIFLLFYASNLLSNNAGHIIIYGKEIDECRYAIINKIRDYILEKDISSVSPFIIEDITIDTNDIKYYEEQIKKSKKFYEYHDSKQINDFGYQLIFYRKKGHKRKYHFKLDILMDENNPILIKRISMTHQVNISKELKSLFQELDHKKTSIERKLEIMLSKFRPRNLGSVCTIYENIKWDKKGIYYSFWNAISSLEIEHLLEIDKINIDINVSLFLNHEPFPNILKDIKNLKVLTINYANVRRKETPIIPSIIGQMQSLRELEIYCNDCYSLPNNLMALANLEKFVFKGSKLNDKSRELVRKMNIKMSGS